MIKREPDAPAMMVKSNRKQNRDHEEADSEVLDSGQNRL